MYAFKLPLEGLLLTVGLAGNAGEGASQYSNEILDLPITKYIPQRRELATRIFFYILTLGAGSTAPITGAEEEAASPTAEAAAGSPERHFPSHHTLET